MAVKDMIKVNGRPVALLGLDSISSRLLKEDPGLTQDEAAEAMLQELSGRNYIPDGARGAYLDALAKRWAMLKGAPQSNEVDDDFLVIRILGPGCVSCDRLEQIVRSVMERHQIEADIEHVKELDEIWRYGVIKTPALVVGKKVMCSGRLPAPAQVMAWLLHAAGKS